MTDGTTAHDGVGHTSDPGEASASGTTLPIRLHRATYVIFLDLPATTCLWGIAQTPLALPRRPAQPGRRLRPDHLGFITYIWSYRRQMAPRVRALITEHAGHAQVHIVRSRRAANRLTEGLHRATTRC